MGQLKNSCSAGFIHALVEFVEPLPEQACLVFVKQEVTISYLQDLVPVHTRDSCVTHPLAQAAMQRVSMCAPSGLW
eukprot:1159351-Pelagomonas_calceolata.AAC.5